MGDAVAHVFEAASSAVMIAKDRTLGQIGPAAQALMGAPYVILSGMGKSGFVAQKAAATMRSLGKPSVFLHPSEASHGDLGLVTKLTPVIILSNSGETQELADLIVRCEQIGAKIIGITGNKESALSRAADFRIIYGPLAEACPHGLAPTTSTTVQQVILDAIAVQLGVTRNVTPDDFRTYHPGGTLGQKIKTVAEVMTPLDKVPILNEGASLGQFVGESKQGYVLVQYDSGVYGIATDGDFKRHFPSHGISILSDIATKSPHMVPETMLLPDVVADFNRLRITAAPVYDKADRVVGVVHMHSLLRGK